MKCLLTLTVSAAVALSATSSFADSLADTIKARPSTEATVGLHLTLGGRANAPAKPSVGAALGFRGEGQTLSQSLTAPATPLAAINFTGGKVEEARLGGLDFAKGDAVDASGRRLGFGSSSPATWLWVALGVAAIWWVVDQNNSNSDLDQVP